MTKRDTEDEFKQKLRDMYAIPLKVGSFKKEEVEKIIETLWKNELEIRRLDKQALGTVNTIKNVLFFILLTILFVAGSYFILKPTPKHHVNPIQQSNIPYTIKP